jgi:DnaK suppressor protein
MNQEERNNFKKEIKKLIIKLEEELSSIRKDADPVSPENAIGRISRMDAINNKGVLDNNIRRREKKIAKLKIALTNVDKSNFGFCRKCQRPIQSGRLMLLPESDYCINCA